MSISLFPNACLSAWYIVSRQSMLIQWVKPLKRLENKELKQNSFAGQQYGTMPTDIFNQYHHS